ncbi:hypothetical protein V6Z11_D11G299200 [Gossypium hirsutum]
MILCSISYFIKSYRRCPFHCCLLEYVAAAQLQPYSLI